MVLNFTKTLQESLQQIQSHSPYLQFIVHESESEPTTQQQEQLITNYGTAKWSIVEMLNQNYGNILERKADLYNWFYHIEDDDISYFLTEAGSNCFNYSQFKAPHQFLLWIGKEGFIIGIEQKGLGFNAKEIDEKNIKQNEGGAFEFYKRTKATIFFDDPESAKIIYMEINFKLMDKVK